MGDSIAPSVSAAPARQRGKPFFRASRDFKKNNLAGYAFLSPWLIAFLLFTLIPMAISLWLAFTNYDTLSNQGTFIGLGNFQRMFFEDTRYGHAVSATIKYVLLSVPLRLAVALGIAMLLNTYRRGVYLYRAAYYIPSIIGGSVAVAVMWRQLFGSEGLVNAAMAFLGIAPVRWLGDPRTAIWTLILLAVWQFGSPMLIFLAGLRQIPVALYEAAEIDGAGSIGKFFSITLPLLTPIIFFNLIIQMIGAFRTFTQAFIVTGGSGAPLDTTLFYAIYLYNRAFNQFQMGYAAAMAWVLLGLIAVLTWLNFRLSNRWVYYETELE
ncbi:MAG: ABC transporter permease subunit [Chloroflexi bacterium]|nr:ABC transporter permease subunit [Chloroflexota bacterium]